MEFTITVADINIKINSIYDEVFALCKDYVSDKTPDFSVSITADDIEFEREKAKREAEFEHRKYQDFNNSYLETLAVYRKIAVNLLRYDAFLMHGAVVGLHGKAYMFTAPSGVGKTTHTRFWLNQFPDAFIINGDKPILRFINNTLYACGTPWSGKESANTNTMLPLKSVCVLTRGDTPFIKPVSFGEIYPILISQSYRPADKEALNSTMSLIKKLGENTAFYLLKCNLDPHSANIAFEGMNK